MENIKDDCRYRAWMMTASEKFWSEEKLTKAFQSYKSGVAVVGQLEEGASGYRHYQLYIEFVNPQRFSGLIKKFVGVHIEPRREDRMHAIKYCTKEKGRVKPYSFGELEPVKEIDGKKVTEAEYRRYNLSLKNKSKKEKEVAVEKYFELIRSGYTASEVIVREPGAWRYGAQLDRFERAVREEREEFYRKNLREVKAFYLSGESRIGKTYYITQKKMKEEKKSVYRVTNYLHPFDSYDGEEILILDEFRTSIDFNLMLNILDGYPLQLPARYGDKTAQFTEVWVVSNEKFYTQYQEVNVMMPSSFIAFKRRFAGFFEMRERGVLTPVTPEGASPEAIARVEDARTEEEVNEILREEL